MHITDSIKSVEENKINELKINEEKTQKKLLTGFIFVIICVVIFILNRYKASQKQRKIIEEVSFFIFNWLKIYPIRFISSHLS